MLRFASGQPCLALRRLFLKGEVLPSELSLPLWGQGRENVSYLSQLPMVKAKGCHWPDWPQLPNPPVGWIIKVTVNDSAEATWQLSLLFLGLWVHSSWDLLFQYPDEASSWVMWNVILNSICKRIVAKRVEVTGRHYLLSVKKEPSRNCSEQKMVWAVMGGREPLCTLVDRRSGRRKGRRED